MRTDSFLRGVGILAIGLGSWFELLLLGSSPPTSLLAKESCLAFILTGGVLVLLSYYIAENEIAIWNVRSRPAKIIRIGVALVIFSFLFVFVLPLIPFKIAVPPCTGSAPILFGCPDQVGGHYSGYNSVGLLLFKWGASWQNGQGYASPFVTGSSIPGLLFIILLPSMLAGIWTMSPEIIDGMHSLKSIVSVAMTKTQDHFGLKRHKAKRVKVL